MSDFRTDQSLEGLVGDKQSDGFLNLLEIEAIAQGRMPKMFFEYFVSGAADEVTLRENRRVFDQLTLYPRVLQDVSSRDLSTVILGRKISFPVIIAPMAFQKLAHVEGELGIMGAADAMETIYCLSTLSTTSLEDVAIASDKSHWFQLYVFRDRGLTRELVERAERAGYGALVLTVDAPLLGRRERDVRNGFRLPDGLSASNLLGAEKGDVTSLHGNSALFEYIASQCDPSLSWSDLEWLRSITTLPIIVKGVLRTDDAERAVSHGAQGIVVSNHGGRQLDTAPAAISVLPRIVEAIADSRVEILVDGGFRRGTDVIKALALGAKAVMLGRPALWALAANGRQGVLDALSLLRDEIELSMALCGCSSLDNIGRDLLDA